MKRLLPIVFVSVAAACSTEGLTSGNGATSHDAGPSSDAAPATSDGGTTTDGDTTTGDAGDTTDSGAPMLGAPCDLSKPFDAPAIVPSLYSGSGEFDARLSSDELTIWFSSGRQTPTMPEGGPGDLIWVAKRASITDNFGMPQLLPNVNDSFAMSPTVTGNGLELFYAASNQNVGTIMLATRPDTMSEFANPAPLMGLMNATNGNPYISRDGNDLFFDSGASSDIYESVRGPQGFGAPKALGLGSSPTQWAADPVITADRKRLYFAAANGNNGADIYTASRSSISDAFDTPAPVSELNTTAGDSPSWLSDDGCRIYIARTDSKNTYNIYLATRPQ
jgi:hypothetical protein